MRKNQNAEKYLSARQALEGHGLGALDRPTYVLGMRIKIPPVFWWTKSPNDHRVL